MAESLRELLNKARWADENLPHYRLVIRHRGAPNDERLVLGADIQDIQAKGLMVHTDFTDPAVSEEDLEDGVAFIPYHRILQVLGPDGVVFERAAD